MDLWFLFSILVMSVLVIGGALLAKKLMGTDKTNLECVHEVLDDLATLASTLSDDERHRLKVRLKLLRNEFKGGV